MADDAVVKIRDVKRAVGAKLQIHRTEPRVVGDNEVRALVGQRRGAGERHRVAVHATGHHVAGENVVAIFLGPEVVLVINDAGNRGGTVSVKDHGGREAEAVVRLAEARIVTAAQELIDRFAVAIGGVKIAERVEAKPERIDLAPGVLLDARAIEPDAISIAGIHLHFVAIRAAHTGVVVVAMRRVEPAVETARE